MTKEQAVEQLWNAAFIGDTNTLRAALAAGADVNVVDQEGRNALQLAIEANATDCVALLKAAGAVSSD